MDYPEKLATLDTQDTGRRQTKVNYHHKQPMYCCRIVNNIIFVFCFCLFVFPLLFLLYLKKYNNST
jgi:hypothetical protein